jgi:hypothetical protein
MPHCDPAPPHPEPGQVYNAICPPDPLAILAVAGLLLIVLALLYAPAVMPADH